MSKLNISEKEKEKKKKHDKSFLRLKDTKVFLENLENSLMSESSLKKDWLTPEEDEAWEDL